MFAFLSYDFMVRALIACILLSFLAPILGVQLVVRRYSTLPDTLAHVSLLGVALALLIGISPFFGALILTGTVALFLERLKSVGKLWGDTLLALCLSGSLALAVIVLRQVPGQNISALLFGSITTIQTSELIVMAVLGAIVLFGVYLLRRDLFLSALHEGIARTEGVRVTQVQSALLFGSAIVVALASRAVGVLLVGALMIIPVITALQHRRGFLVTMRLSVLYALVASLVGLGISFYADLPSGPAIVLVATSVFIIALLVHRKGQRA